jgi:hypothetical protein
LFDKILQCRQVLRQLVRHVRRALQLSLQEALSECVPLLRIVAQQQLLVDLLNAAGTANRVFVGRPGFKSCQGSHGCNLSV